MKTRTYKPFRRFVRVSCNGSPIDLILTFNPDRAPFRAMFWEDNRTYWPELLPAPRTDLRAAITDLCFLGVWDAARPLTITTWTTAIP